MIYTDLAVFRRVHSCPARPISTTDLKLFHTMTVTAEVRGRNIDPSDLHSCPVSTLARTVASTPPCLVSFRHRVLMSRDSQSSRSNPAQTSYPISFLIVGGGKADLVLLSGFALLKYVRASRHCWACVCSRSSTRRTSCTSTREGEE